MGYFLPIGSLHISLHSVNKKKRETPPAVVTSASGVRVRLVGAVVTILDRVAGRVLTDALTTETRPLIGCARR